MAKISTYANQASPQLADKLIGTKVGGNPVDATFNFTLQSLLSLFSQNITLQTVLNAGNTATQNIILTGNITSTRIIPGNIQDDVSSIGALGQVLSKSATGIKWVNLAPFTTPGLAAVTAVDNTTTLDIYANSFYTNTGYGLLDDGTVIGETFQFPSTLSYIDYNGAGFNVWQLPNQSGTIALLSDITGANDLNSVLTNGNISQIDAKVGGIFLYNPNVPSGNGYVYITGDKNRFNFYNNANVNFGNISQDSLVLIDSVVPSRQFQIKKPATIGATRTATFQDASGTVAYTSDIPASGYLPQTTASGTDVYTASVSGVAAYLDGAAYLVRFTNGNTAAATLNINSLGAVPLFENNGGALIGGDILDGSEILCVYNLSLNIFQCIGTSPNSLFAYVTNADSVAITKGQPVFAFGGTGDRMTVKRAFNTSDATSAQTIGLVLSSSIAAGQKGIIIIQGLLDGLNTLPTSTFSDGDPVYLGATAGQITNVKPYAPNHLVYLGVVTTASNGSAGRMYVKVQNGYELQELHNVQAQSPANKDTLYYDNLDNQWKTASIATILGYAPEQPLTFNSPLSRAVNAVSLPVGNLTEATSSVLTILGGTGSVVGSGVSIQVKQATISQSGFLSSTDWNVFNNKQSTITLTTTGSSGPATFIANALNIPQYTLNGLLPSQSGQAGKFLYTDGTNASWNNISRSFKLGFNSIGDYAVNNGAGVQNLGVNNLGLFIGFDLTTAPYATISGSNYVFNINLITHEQFGGIPCSIGVKTIYSSSAGSTFIDTLLIASYIPQVGTNFALQRVNLSINVPVTYLGQPTDFFKFEVLVNRTGGAGTTSIIGANILFNNV
jgi:hypothetical protein